MLVSIFGSSGTKRRFGSSFNAQALSTVSALAIAVASFAAPHSARAAEQAAAQEAEQSLEEIVITGSRIIREGFEAPTPLSVIDTTTLERAPAANIAEYVNTLPVFAGSQQPNTAQNSISAGNAGINTLNLRGIGGNRTLVLLDGQRSVGSILSGGVDINAFPQQLISRVEVVTGGASAVYGSDAVGGVANFILDKTYTGVKGEVSGGLTSYGDDKNAKVTVAAGFDVGQRGHVLLSGEHVYQQGVQKGANGRAWDDTLTVNMLNPLYGTGAGQSTSVPQRLIMDNAGFSNATSGGMITSGPFKGTAFGEGGVPYTFVYGSIIANPFMVGGSAQQSLIERDQIGSLNPGQKRSNIFIRGDYDITDNFNVFVQVSWNGSRSFSQCCPQFQPGNVATGQAGNVLKSDNAFLPASIRTAMAAQGVTSFQYGSMNGDMGPFGSNNERNVNRQVIGASGKFGAFNTDWSWDAYFQNGFSRNSVNITNVGNNARFRQAIDAVFDPTNGRIVCRSTLTSPNNGCVPYNVFGRNVNDIAAIRYVRADIGSYQYSHLTQNVWAGAVTGEPFSIWAGPVSLALSAEHRTEKVANISDSVSQSILTTGVAGWFAGNYLPINGSFNVSEAAAETVIPLAKGESWADAWDLSAAARFTHYSTSGNVVTWKVGTTFTPIQDIKLRVTRSRDIRAPNLQELFAAGTSSQGEVFDPFTNTTPTVRGFATGNLNLKPEKADTTGIGIVLQPSFIPGFSASVDWWNINIKDAVASVSTANTVRLCFEGNQQFCPFITRVNGIITQVQTAPVNLAVQKTNGLDIEGSYRFALDDVISGTAGDFAIHGNATMYFENLINDGITAVRDTAGQNGGGEPPDWRYSLTLSYDLDPISVSLTGRAISKGTYDNSYIVCTSGCPVSTTVATTINNNTIPGRFWMDASISYKFMIGEEVNAEAFLNIRNLGNVDPPKLYTIYYLQNTNQQAYDALGRVFRAGVRFKM